MSGVDERRVRGIAAQDAVGLRRQPRKRERFAKARLPGVHRACGVAEADKRHALTAAIEQVARDEGAGPAVVEADQIVAAALRIRLD